MAQAPSPPSLDELLSHMGWVRNLARGLVREEDAEDLAQETMLRAIQTPPKHSENLKGWLAMISRNLMRSTNRRDSRRAQRFEQRQPQPLEPPKPEELFYRAEMAENVRKLVDRLDDNTRYLILLRFHEERKVDEIAQMLGISRRAAQSRLDRAMAKLRESMRVHFGDNYLVACLILAAPVGPPIATAVPAGTGAAAGGISGSGMAVLLQGLLAIAALLLPVYFVAFDSSADSSLAHPELVAGENVEAQVGTQEPVQPTRTETTTTVPDPDQSTIQLTVLDDNGLPVPTAEIAVRRGGGISPNQLWTSHLDSDRNLIARNQADEMGRASLDLPAVLKLNILVGSRYHHVERLRVTTPQTGENKELTAELSEAACVVGTATDGIGNPIAKAVVLLQRASSLNKFRTRTYVHRTVTGEDGSYELPSVPVGDYVLQVGHPGYERLIGHPFTITEDHCGHDVQRPLELSRGLSISGKFEDTDGDPVAGARIWVMDPSELPRDSADPVPPHNIDISGESAEDGTFLVHGWSQARGSGLMILAPGYLTKVVPNAEISDPLNITLQRGLNLSIRVEEDDQPIAAAHVKLVHRLTSTRSRSQSTTTQANGRATFHGLAPGMYYATVADTRGYGSTQPFELTASGQLEIIELTHGAGFQLSAVDENGEALSNLGLHLMYLRPLPNGAVDGGMGTTGQSSASGKTDSNGQYQIHLRPGVWHVQASPKGRTKLKQEIELHGDRVFQLKHQFGLTGSLEITAMDPAGQPLKELWVALAPEEGRHHTNRMDSAGKSHFTGLKPGTYMLYPWEPTSQPKTTPEGAMRVEIRAGEKTTVDLDNSFVSLPNFRVLRQGKPLEGAQIRLTPLFSKVAPTFDSRHATEEQTDARGNWQSGPVRVGRYLITERGDQNQPEQRWTMELKSGMVSHDLHLQEFQVSGRLVLPTGEAIRAVRVELDRQVRAADGSIMEAPLDSDGNGWITATSGVNGEFHFANVPAGTWQLRIRGQHWTGPSRTLFSVTESDVDLGTLKVEESCGLKLKLSARALREAEKGPRSTPAFAVVHLASQMRYQLFPNDQGIAERRDLPSGDYELLFSDRPATPLKLAAGSVVEWNLD